MELIVSAHTCRMPACMQCALKKEEEEKMVVVVVVVKVEEKEY